MIAIQRALNKVLISVFLSREFKHDETNRAWWTGKWYGRGLGNYVMSQPAREFIVKIVELSLWTSDFLIAHFLLFILTPACLIPYGDTIHATLLCKWCLQACYPNLQVFVQSGFGHQSRFGHRYIQ